MKHFTKQSSFLCSLHGKIGIKSPFTHQKRKIMNSKKPSATKHSPPSNVYFYEILSQFFISK